MNLRAFFICSLILFLAACSSQVSRRDLDSQEGDVRQGNEKTVDRLFEKRSRVAEPDMDRYVQVLGEAPAEKSSVLLRSLFDDPNYQKKKGLILHTLAERPDETNAEFIRTRLNEEPALYDDQLESYLIQRGDRASAETILSMVTRGQAVLNPRNIAFFGQVGLASSLPALQAQADQGKDAAVVMETVAKLGTAEASEYLLQTAANPTHPARVPAVRRLSGAADQSRARATLHSVLKESRDPALLTAAGEALRDMGYNEESYALLKQVYARTDNAEVRTATVDSMATLRQVDSVDLRKELGEPDTKRSEPERRTSPTGPDAKKKRPRGLTQAYSDSDRLTEIITNRPAQNPHAKPLSGETKREQKERRHRTERPSGNPAPVPAPTQQAQNGPRPVFRLDESDAASEAYARRLSAQLANVLGQDAPAVRLRIHNALLSYAESDSASAQFVQRAYRKGYGVDETKARELLKKGLHTKNSLQTILAAVTAEYGRRDLQVYALASFFALKRKEAERLIEAYHRRSL